MIYTSKKIIIFLFTIMQLAILSSCMDSGYRLSFPEIDDVATNTQHKPRYFSLVLTATTTKATISS